VKTFRADEFRLALVTPYVVSFAAGMGTGVIFWLLRTPTPVPPLIGLVGLLGIAFGEIVASRAVTALRGRYDRDEPDGSPGENHRRRHDTPTDSTDL
jgi:XapX domain-containing protein